MSHTLTPILAPIDQLRNIVGGSDPFFTAKLIEQNKEELIQIDELGEFYAEFEEDFQWEYENYEKGDFSYQHQFWPLDEQIPSDEAEELCEALVNEDEAKTKEFLSDLLDEVEDGACVKQCGALRGCSRCRPVTRTAQGSGFRLQVCVWVSAYC